MTHFTPSRGLAAAFLSTVLLLAACGGDGTGTTTTATASPAITATAQATATATPASPPTATRFEAPLASLAIGHVQMLAGEIGPRSSTTEQELQAAEYVASQLRASGYSVTVEPFDAESSEELSTVVLPDGAVLGSTDALLGSPNLTASGPVFRLNGLGHAFELAQLDLAGTVLVVDRGKIQFATKAANAEQAGVVALVVVNNVEGPLAFASLGDGEFSIPIVGIAREDAAALSLIAAEGGSVQVTTDRRVTVAPSWNVVARTAEGCTALVGAHYDSVPQGPGANDNASGTSAMIELARTHHAAGLCYVAFGSEEVGLFGSLAFIEQHGTDNLRFMLNLDMVGKLTDTRFIATTQPASQELANRGAALASALGHDIPRGAFPSFASSDHAPFAAAGVAAITITSGNDEFIHQPQDVVANVSVDALQLMLDVTAELLRDLLLQ
jgi:acetylornithine deacetylase/succinyl-diaminopimelate desuccinylase-like protein